MTISVVDLFSIGIGPSSSHTVGPMRAAKRFLDEYAPTPAHTLVITLHGSLAATGKGHGTDRAIILGLQGLEPDAVPADHNPKPGETIAANGEVHAIPYRIIFDPVPLPEHPNAVTFTWGTITQRYFSVGGGFILSAEELDATATNDTSQSSLSEAELPFVFHTATQLLQLCSDQGLTIPLIMRANEEAIHGDLEIVNRHLDAVWHTMQQCVTAGLKNTGVLPGGLEVTRRAPDLYDRLSSPKSKFAGDPLSGMEWVNLYALAVNEENAAGGRVVTAPTNGAAGVIPAVMHYIAHFCQPEKKLWARDFLLTAGAVGMIIKENASISGAEVGCQGEVGSAAAMAAAGTCQVLGGTPAQIENAAEIALEHNLGLTCDPVGGLVQIPCIERNAIASVQAINAARLALLGTGIHRISLDDAVQTMAETGRDMMGKYKETATGGLAIRIGIPVAITEC